MTGKTNSSDRGSKKKAIKPKLVLHRQFPNEADYIDDEMFHRRGAEKTLFGPESEKIDVPLWRPPEGLEKALALAEKTLLTQQQQEFLFLQFNYARFRVGKLMKKKQKTAETIHDINMWHQRAMKARANLVRGNLALVYAMARRMHLNGVEFSEMISEGNMALLRSVEKFNVSRGCRFSTYACRSILKSFSRLAKKVNRRHKNIPTQSTSTIEFHEITMDINRERWEDSLDTLREILRENQARLSEVEKTIVKERFSLERGGKGRTLTEIASMVGLTNERVRQLQINAIGKIRTTMEKFLPSPGGKISA